MKMMLFLNIVTRRAGSQFQTHFACILISFWMLNNELASFPQLFTNSPRLPLGGLTWMFANLKCFKVNTSRRTRPTFQRQHDFTIFPVQFPLRVGTTATRTSPCTRWLYRAFTDELLVEITSLWRIERVRHTCRPVIYRPHLQHLAERERNLQRCSFVWPSGKSLANKKILGG